MFIDMSMRILFGKSKAEEMISLGHGPRFYRRLKPIRRVGSSGQYRNWFLKARPPAICSIGDLHQPFPADMGFGNRGIISDKWSSRVLWVCAIGSAIGFYMVAVERQTQNRAKMMAEALGDAGSSGEEA